MKKEMLATDETNVLRVANSRGKRPVMTDIKKARNLINGILVELNPNEAKKKLQMVDSILWAIMHEPQNL
jgi:hypothetical protein